jgi:hypothetical protein
MCRRQLELGLRAGWARAAGGRGGVAVGGGRRGGLGGWWQLGELGGGRKAYGAALLGALLLLLVRQGRKAYGTALLGALLLLLVRQGPRRGNLPLAGHLAHTATAETCCKRLIKRRRVGDSVLDCHTIMTI